MGRSPRNLESSDFFHVSNRGVDKQDIFFTDADRLHFESELERMVEVHDVSLMAYALMSNHHHLLLRCEGGRLPMAIAELQSRFTKRLNTRIARSGPLFERRYWSKPVVGDDHFLATARYIHRNPISICGGRALGAYRWSSLAVYLGRRPAPSWMSTQLLAARIDPDRQLAQLVEVGVDDLVPLDGLPASCPVTIEQVEAAVADAGGVPAVGRSDGRLLCDLLGEQLRCGDIVDRAERRGIAPRSLRNSIRRAAARVELDADFAGFRSRALERLRSTAT